uniref:Glycosyltransferase involved in cell wall bisynthesis n=1 Tax=Candidatus Kentrum sp. UNK TaxID=2126344 RepID=A0A451AT53_9GAMM|nr:MAG: Glycosyltransferase involved in cell wall bisynthesis [Candidatus Kentron sp. UNK]VFK69206.1 MAG: Glycosyltransferase involved in cell wall bisynthesis [Candidatus Kentron sp. UNK]
MRIMNTVFGDATGGRWRVVLDYARVLTGLGHEVLLVLNPRTADRSRVGELPEGVRLAWVRNSGHYDLFAVWRARRLIRQFQPDAIIAHCGRSVAVMSRAAQRRVPVIGVSHSNNVKRMLRADAYFNISTHIDGLIRAYPHHSELAYHLPNMIEIPVGLEFQARPFHNPPRIGAMGRFDHVKGMDIYVRALGILQQQGYRFRAFLGGGGEEEENLIELGTRLGLGNTLSFIGWVKDPSVFFTELDILCIPSRSDAFGITPLEAGLAGVPQILSDAYGHRDMFIDGQHARLVPRERPDLLAAALGTLLDDEPYAHALAQRAFSRVTGSYGATEFAVELERNLEDVLNRFRKC